jgi:hypothetical protein
VPSSPATTTTLLQFQNDSGFLSNKSGQAGGL